jgi:hypothetical protein
MRAEPHARCPVAHSPAAGRHDDDDGDVVVGDDDDGELAI